MRGRRNLDHGTEAIEDPAKRRRAAQQARGVLLHSMLLGAAVTVGSLFLP